MSRHEVPYQAAVGRFLSQIDEPRLFPSYCRYRSYGNISYEIGRDTDSSAELLGQAVHGLGILASSFQEDLDLVDDTGPIFLDNEEVVSDLWISEDGAVDGVGAC